MIERSDIMKSVEDIIKSIIKEKPECKHDEMKLYYEYVKYKGVSPLQFLKLFIDEDFRKCKKIRKFSTISRTLRNLR